MVDHYLCFHYITYDSKGWALLYVKMNNALYGLLKSALWFYEKFCSDINVYGFKISPYDQCVANADLNGHQMTVMWHVDDLKVSHKDPFEITFFAQYLSTKYGEQMTVKFGQVHDQGAN